MTTAEIPDAQPFSSEPACRKIALAVVAIAIAARAWMAWTTHSTAEDFLITLRYAENIARGQGFSYNPGEAVLGTTTPLYTLVLALCSWLHLDAAVCGKTLNICADGLTCWLLMRLAARKPIDQPVAGLFAGLLYALGSTALNISIGGMETALVTCAGMGAITALLCGNARALCLCAAVLFLLRLDTLLLSACLLIAHCLQTRRVPWRDLGLAFVLVLPWVVFALSYFGSFVPTSLTAKILVYGHPQMAQRDAVFSPFRQQFLSGASQIALTLLACVGTMRVLKHRKWQLLAPLLWLLLYYGVMLTSRVPAFAWYFLPPWPLFLLLACLGALGGEKKKRRKEEEKRQRIENETETLGADAAPRRNELLRFRAFRLMSEGYSPLTINPVSEDHFAEGSTAKEFIPLLPRSRPPFWWVFALILVGLFGLAHLRSVRADIQSAQALEDTVRRPVGLWLQGQVKPGERVLLEPIGTIGYYSHVRILDMIGLTSPEVFASYHTPAPLADIVRRLRPEWLCLRPNEVERLQESEPSLLANYYQEICQFRATDGRIVFVMYHRKQDSAPPIAQ